ncbi:hypothetical protein EON80_12415 [bacterium]|nr:MAG: hypothetical protein EON80_12415 [bacterium]
MKRREMLWMLLPCLALLGFGLTSWRLENLAPPSSLKPKPKEPLRLEVQVSYIPLSFVDGNGPNARMEVLVTCAQPAPAGWGNPDFGVLYSDTRFSVRRGGKLVRLMDNSAKTFKGTGLPISVRGFDRTRNGYLFDFFWNTRAIPKSYGIVVFESEWFQRPGVGHYSAVGEKSFAHLRKIGAPHATGRVSFKHG